MAADSSLVSPRFPRSNSYHPDWIVGHASGGANALWLAEWLSEVLAFKPGMRVLDLGCGRAATSIFLAREFGVQVWAADLWFNVSENFRRISDAGLSDRVFPIHCDARSLPFAHDYFDAIVSLDSFCYYGTDDNYLNYLAHFVKPGGVLGMAGAGLTREIEGELPEYLRAWWTPSMWCLHSAAWWRRHWERTGIVEVEVADTMADGWQVWLDWHRACYPDNVVEIQALEADRGDTMGYTRLVARRRPEAVLEQVLTSVATDYVYRPLLRTGADGG